MELEDKSTGSVELQGTGCLLNTQKDVCLEDSFQAASFLWELEASSILAEEVPWKVQNWTQRYKLSGIQLATCL